MTTTPRGAPQLVQSQAIPETTVNEQIRHTEAGAGHFIVADKDLTSPPGSCADGASYIIAATASGAWTGKEKQIATAVGANASNGWIYHAPIEGYTAYLQDENARYLYDGSSWGVDTTGGSYTDEQARDAVGTALVEGAGIDITVNDGADTITIASTITQYTDEMARDALGIALTAGTGISITPNDGADAITIAATGGGGTAATLDFDTDGTLAANSDALIPTQKAVKTAIATAVTGLLEFKGSTDCSANPNYPAASKGDAYVVSVAGKIGGGSGASVDVGDVYVASADNAGGTQASVGTSWFVLEHNLAGVALLSGATFVGDVEVPDDAYGAGWNGSTKVPTRNAVYDKIEAIVAGIPGSYTDEMARDAVGASLTDTGLAVVTVNDGADTIDINVPAAAASDINTGTDTTKALTADALAGSNLGTGLVTLMVSDPAGSAITTGDGKAYYRVPSVFNGMDLVGVAAALTTVSSSGIPTIQIANVTQAADMLTTKLTIDASETDSSTAATAAVIDTGNDDVATGDMLRIDIDVAGTGAKGLIVQMLFRLP